MGEFLLKIDPMYEKKDFLRKAWISLAKEDAPMDVFEQDLSEVAEEHYRIVGSTAQYETTWEGEIGNDRRESYIDIENYYERIPYTEYERQYNSTTKQYDNVPVTKYRNEQRQRQVTKYRTVTDWHSGNGSDSGSVTCFACADDNSNYDKSRLLADFKSDYCADLSADELAEQPDMCITPSLQDFVYDIHSNRIEEKLRNVLPGDHTRSVTYKIQRYDVTNTSLIKVPEYVTTIKRGGQTYEKRAFAFGEMTMSSAGIPNPISAEAKKKQLRDKKNFENDQRNKQIDDKIWNASKLLSLISVALLALSVLVSAFVKYLFLVILCFVAAVGMFVFFKIRFKAIRASIEKKTKEENLKADQECARQCNDYEKIQRAKLLEALNKKLTSLGYKPATEAEMLKG